MHLNDKIITALLPFLVWTPDIKRESAVNFSWVGQFLSSHVCDNDAMKLNTDFPTVNVAVKPKINRLQSFNVRCEKCNSLRVILIAELNPESGELHLIHSIGSRKNYCCELSFPQIAGMDSG
ncbi:MAG: hypothetical protein WDN00_04705 [Limisphaerales bacterium]